MPPAPSDPGAKLFDVAHRTVYQYTLPVARSTHDLRIVPAHDHLQHLLRHTVIVTADGEPLPSGQVREYEDVFGSRVLRVRIERPYSELVIALRATVRCLVDPLLFDRFAPRLHIPLSLEPWQRDLVQPFLPPPEMRAAEHRELLDYATQLAARNDADVMRTLVDLNSTIHRDYAYHPGSTTLTTSAFEVYRSRRGVCQDFANLFLCVARLLGVPARYVSGYVYTGPKASQHVQSESSHAWVQAFLPEIGWRGFDPTNGVLPETDHVRVALGRSAIDATPTSGTVYGGGGESLRVDVSVEKR